MSADARFRNSCSASPSALHVGPITGKWVSVLSALIRNERGTGRRDYMPLDLKAYDPNIPVQHAGKPYGFFADDGIDLAQPRPGVIGTGRMRRPRGKVEMRDGEFRVWRSTASPASSRSC
jgi:hypothetical protein